MYVPFVFSMDTLHNTENYFHWAQFFVYAEACSRNQWPIISHERYFARFSHVGETVFGIPLQSIASTYCLRSIPTTEEMQALRTYPVPQVKEDALISQYASQFDCWLDLLKSDHSEFEKIIGDLLDRITTDYGEKPEGVLVYEYMPKALLRAANQRGIPVIFQAGGIVRPPFSPSLNACSLINTNSAEAVKVKYENFLSNNDTLPILTRKGLLRLFISEQYMADVHNIDHEPQYDVGVLYNNMRLALHHVGQTHLSDQELSARAKAKYDKVLIRTRPGFEPAADSLDNSATCFHFCCKCKHVLGFATKGMFEAMLAGRIPHEYGSFLFYSFSNNGIEDNSRDSVPIAFLNFILFGLCAPFSWLTNPDYIRSLISNPSEREQYIRGFQHYTQGISNEDLKRYYMSEDRAYRLGDALYFTSGHKPHEYAAYYCCGGLDVIGKTCTWSNGESSSFEFDLTETENRQLIISVVLYDVLVDRLSSDPVQTITCEANGVFCGLSKLTPGKKYLRFSIPAECYLDKLRIIFRYGYLCLETDRKSAIAFEQMYISYAGQRSIEDALIEENTELERSIYEFRASCETQSALISKLEELNSGLEKELLQLEAQIHEVFESRSWKLGHCIMRTLAKVIPQKK